MNQGSRGNEEEEEEEAGEKREERIVRLRDPWLPENEHGWTGKAGALDKDFWSKS